ncbi:MAG: restriction endonuclease subunit S [Myxococcota bacterium]
MIRGTNMGRGRWLDGEFAFVSPEKADSLSANLARPGDILFTQRGTLGQVALVPDKGFDRYLISQSQMKLTVDPAKACAHFLYYVFTSAEQQAYIRQNAIQTGVPHTNLGILRGTPIVLPSLRSQKSIAHLLGTLDDKIELNRRMNETLEAMARALFKSWFVDFDPVRANAQRRQPTGMDAETAKLFPSEFVKSELGEIPKGWRSVPLSEAAELNPLRRIEKGAPAPYVEMSSLPTTGHRPSAWPLRQAGSGARFQNGDTLLARITPCLENGKTGYVDFLDNGVVAWGSTEYMVVRPRAPLPPEWGYLLARDNVFREFAAQKMEGTTGRQRVSADSLGRYVVALPCSAVGERFGQLVAVFFRKTGANHDENATLAGLRDALLPRLLSGELSVKTAAQAVEAIA